MQRLQNELNDIESVEPAIQVQVQHLQTNPKATKASTRLFSIFCVFTLILFIAIIQITINSNTNYTNIRHLSSIDSHDKRYYMGRLYEGTDSSRIYQTFKRFWETTDKSLADISQMVRIELHIPVNSGCVEIVLSNGTEIMHGTPSSSESVDDEGDGPIWFAYQPSSKKITKQNVMEFSLHAGAYMASKSQSDAVYIHKYGLTTDINILVCSDYAKLWQHSDIPIFMNLEGQPNTLYELPDEDSNSPSIVGMASLFQKEQKMRKSKGGSFVFGYVILKDARRREPELILVDHPLGKYLGHQDTVKWNLHIKHAPGREVYEVTEAGANDDGGIFSFDFVKRIRKKKISFDFEIKD